MAADSDQKPPCVKLEAQAEFRRAIRDPKTREALKLLLGRVIKDNPGKNRSEIVAIFEREKAVFARGLQQTACAAGRAQCAAQ
jgi:hypothetical protein